MTRNTTHTKLRRSYSPAVRRAYSLVEMLIVMTIMLMLVVVALPAVKRVMEDGNVREASRQLNSYFAMAKARALQTGRPCGVIMLCEPVLGIADPPAAVPLPTWPTRQVTKMYLAEVPPPYSGGTVGAKGRIMLSTAVMTTPPTYEFYPIDPATYGPDAAELAILSTLIEPGERFFVRFDFKGPWFACIRSGTQLIFQTPAIPGFTTGMTQALSQTPRPPGIDVAGSPGYTYQIIRMPRRIGNPLELTGGTCIDVAYSGVGPMNLPTNTVAYGMYDSSNPPTTPRLQTIAVMFTPGGGVDSVFLNDLAFVPATTVHFLIGRADKCNPPLDPNPATPTNKNMFDPAASNLADPQSLWVSVSVASGNVNTSDNLPPPMSNPSAVSAILYSGMAQQQTINPSQSSGQVTYLGHCRQLATNREQMRGQ